MWLGGAVPQSDACCDLPRRVPGAAYSHLLGLYLGDGHISFHRRTPRLRIFYDSRYPGLIGEGVRSMRAVLPHARVHVCRPTHVNCVVVSSYSCCWLCLLPSTRQAASTSADSSCCRGSLRSPARIRRC